MRSNRKFTLLLILLVLSSLLLSACYNNSEYSDDYEDEDWEEEDWDDEDYQDEDYQDEDEDWDESEEGSGLIEEIVGLFLYDDPDDCWEDEIYDGESQLCLPADDDGTFSWLDENEDQVFDENMPTFGSEEYGEYDEIVLLTYSVNDSDQIAQLSQESVSDTSAITVQQDTNSHQQIWMHFAALIPQDARESIDQYVVFTDGQDGTMAWMEPLSDDLTAWSMAVDPADAADPKELSYTFVHEYGHYLTLNATQIEGGASSCSVYKPQEGCSHNDSYLNLFYERFWAGEIYETWDDIQYEDDDDKYYERLDAFYDEHKDQFVTDYAATNPEEDIAESWAHFVLKAKPDGDTIAEQKILFFYDFPELVELRSQIAARTVSRARR